jgi:CheY-like chemotaxis protein
MPHGAFLAPCCVPATGSSAAKPRMAGPAVRKFDELRPDVVLLDLAMPEMNGIEAAKRMSASDSTVPLILFTILEIQGIENAAREAGIRAIVPKSEASNLIRPIQTGAYQKPGPRAHQT